jgi:GH15 family glucan-1,4-alpha-glucosidase
MERYGFIPGSTPRSSHTSVLRFVLFLERKAGTNKQLDPDMSIWEVRNKKQNFTYSKVMLWVAFDRGLRLADKRCFPCPNRAAWLATRDEIYEEVMEKGRSSHSLLLFILTISRLQQKPSLLHPKL